MAKKKQLGGKRPGAGRKIANPEGRTMPVVASVPVALIERLDALAEEKKWNRSQAITQAVRNLVDNSDK